MQAPNFIDKPMLLKPFKKGVPRKWLALITPFLEKNIVTREEMIKAAGITKETTDGRFSNIFSMLNERNIISYDPSLKKWRRGENWFIFLGWLLFNLCNWDVPRSRAITFFKKYMSNSTNFIATTE